MFWRALPVAVVLGCMPLAAGFVSLSSTRPQQLLPVCPSVVSMFRHDNCGSHSMIVGISRTHHLVLTDVLRVKKCIRRKQTVHLRAKYSLSDAGMM